MMAHLVGRSQWGFTRIGLLAVLAVVVILAGVAVPGLLQIKKVGQIRGAQAELVGVTIALQAMMVDHGISSLPDPGPGTSGGLRTTSASATNDMSVFPYTAAGDYALVGGPNGDYLSGNTTATYFVDSTGMVYQATSGHE